MTEARYPSGGRRAFLRAGAVAGAAALAAPAIATAAGAPTTWRVQTSWPGGDGLRLFREWCASIVEKTDGALVFEALSPADGGAGLDIYEAVRTGRVDAINPFTLYASRISPAANFLSSYPMAMRAPHEFDTFYYGLGGLEIARDIWARNGLYFVAPIHHGPNIIHSKKAINRLTDFRGLRMRTPGGMVAEFFQELGAKTVALPGEEIFPAFERGEIDVADYVGPAVNYALGFSKVTRFISMGPPGYMSVYQPVDLMDLTVNLGVWQRLSPELQRFVETEVQAYSNRHHAGIQAADQVAWEKFEADGTVVSRLSAEDVDLMTKVAVPIWVKYARQDPDALKVFRIQLQYMTSGSLGYVDPAIYEYIAADL